MAGSDPWLTLLVKIRGANEVLHGERSDEPAVLVIDDDAIIFPVANPYIAVCGIDSGSMGIVEFSRTRRIPKPLIDEFAILVEVNHARGANIVERISRIDVIGTLVSVTFEDVDVTVGTEVNMGGFPD